LIFQHPPEIAGLSIFFLPSKCGNPGIDTTNLFPALTFRASLSFLPFLFHNPTGDPAMSQPVDKFNEGSVHVSIFENSGPKGAFRTATIQLRYKDKESDEWKTGASYGLGDLKNLEKAAKEARTRIEAWQQQNKPTPKNAA
jgi:hypothetical protein